MNRLVASFFVVVALALSLVAQEVRRNGPPTSPFRGMRAVENGLEVQVDSDTWFALVKIASVDTATLLTESKRLCGDDQWKRLTEDLPAVLEAMGHPVGDAVDLELRSLDTGKTETRTAVAMTGANRQRLRDANRGDARPAADGRRAEAPPRCTAAAARDDLDALGQLLDERFAYRHLRKIDLAALLRDAKARIPDDGLDRDAFARVVDGVLRAFGDGHSRVDGARSAGVHFLPCLVQKVEGGHVAFRADRSALVDGDRPFLVAIDDVPLERWLVAAADRATQGSAVMRAHQGERGLRELGELRTALGLPASDTVQLRLRGTKGERVHQLPVGSRSPAYGAWPRTTTRRLEAVGYLRLADMANDASFLDGLDAAMQDFRDTAGLIVDVRGNGGGTRDALRRLAPYFLPKDGAPVVGNVAAVLLDRGAPPPKDALADRGLFPLDWDSWSGAQRGAIATFTKTWQPSWTPTSGRFSPWHFLLLDRADNPKAFAYQKPVVVLIDRGCFSATDVFAAALGALPNVRLVGEATSGGSGRAKGHVLPKSGVRLQLSTMASYRPDGVLFEGNGVVPDVEVAMQPMDLIGATDTVLQKALELLR